VHPEDLQGVADEVELAFSHPVGVEDVGLGPESVGEHQFWSFLSYGAADEAGDLAVPVMDAQRQAPSIGAGGGVAALEGFEGLGGEVKRGQGLMGRVEPLGIGFRVEPCYRVNFARGRCGPATIEARGAFPTTKS
jgi:hypothetical protein